MAHDVVDTNVRSRRLNGVTCAAIDTTGQAKSNSNDVSSSSSSSYNTSSFGSTEVKDTTKNGVHLNTNNNYLNGRPEGTCNGNGAVTNDAVASDTDAIPNTVDNNHLSCMRGSLLHDNVAFVPRFRWPDLIVQIFLHVGALYGLLFQFYSIKFFTMIWFFALIIGSGFGITAGAHRLWSHKAYKAKWQLRLLLTFLFTISGQRDAYTWAHDHRVHHKYSETDADPHDARRGFFFAHIGWLFLTPHPEVVAKRKIVDMSDLELDPIVMWQKRLYEPLFVLLAIAMPVLVPWYFWDETLWTTFWVNFTLRFTITLNIAFFVNSVAHMYGTRPYDKSISPAESLPVALAAFGEGWHNYHHVFPWDYKTGELGDYKYNVSTAFIDFFSKIGWAYDRKYVSSDMIARRAARCGDGTHFLFSDEAHTNPVWGLGDNDICQEDLIELEKMTG